jgi:hypothetical protein
MNPLAAGARSRCVASPSVSQPWYDVQIIISAHRTQSGSMHGSSCKLLSRSVFPDNSGDSTSECPRTHDRVEIVVGEHVADAVGLPGSDRRNGVCIGAPRRRIVGLGGRCGLLA